MVGGWDPDEAVAVVNSRFCADRHVYLRIQDRRSWTGNEFDISDDTTKQPWFQVAAKACGCCRRKTLVDLGGDVVATLRSPAILHSSRMHVKGRGFSFHVCLSLCQGHGPAAVVRMHRTAHALQRCTAYALSRDADTDTRLLLQ